MRRGAWTPSGASKRTSSHACQELLAGLYRLTEPRTFSTAAQPLAQDGGSIGGPATQPFWKEL